MIHLCLKLDLWRLEWIVRWKMDRHKEHASTIRAVSRSHDRRLHRRYMQYPKSATALSHVPLGYFPPGDRFLLDEASVGFGGKRPQEEKIDTKDPSREKGEHQSQKRELKLEYTHSHANKSTKKTGEGRQTRDKRVDRRERSNGNETRTATRKTRTATRRAMSRSCICSSHAIFDNIAHSSFVEEGHHGRTCQWKRSSPAGPALQDVGGSFWRS